MVEDATRGHQPAFAGMLDLQAIKLVANAGQQAGLTLSVNNAKSS